MPGQKSFIREEKIKTSINTPEPRSTVTFDKTKINPRARFVVQKADSRVLTIFRTHFSMRGGYCWVSRRPCPPLNPFLFPISTISHSITSYLERSHTVLEQTTSRRHGSVTLHVFALPSCLDYKLSIARTVSCM